MFTNGQSAVVKLQSVGERGLKIVAQTLARTRFKRRQYFPLAAPQGPLAGSQAPVAGPQAPLEGPQAPVTGPQALLAGPQALLAGPQALVAGPQVPLRLLWQALRLR